MMGHVSSRRPPYVAFNRARWGTTKVGREVGYHDDHGRREKKVTKLREKCQAQDVAAAGQIFIFRVISFRSASKARKFRHERRSLTYLPCRYKQLGEKLHHYDLRPRELVCDQHFTTTMTSIQLFDDDLDIAGVPAPSTAPTSVPSPAEPASILVVASQEAAQDGSYQALVSQLSIKGKVEMQMVDRIMEGGKSSRSFCRGRIKSSLIR